MTRYQLSIKLQATTEQEPGYFVVTGCNTVLEGQQMALRYHKLEGFSVRDRLSGNVVYEQNI